MRSSTIDERFAQLIEKPTLQTYLAVREPIVNDPRYDPYSDELRQLGMHVDLGDSAGAREMVAEMQPMWRLSPRFHFLAGLAALEIGDRQAADEEKRISRACMYGLSLTGDGSCEQPYLITYLSDAYDLSQWTQFDVCRQQLVEIDGACYDVLFDADDEECWFDVTDLLDVGRRSRAKGSEKRHPIARQV